MACCMWEVRMDICTRCGEGYCHDQRRLPPAIEHEAQSEPNKHRTGSLVECLDHARSPQPSRERTRRKRKDGKPKDSFCCMNGRKQHAERGYRDSGGNEL